MWDDLLMTAGDVLLALLPDPKETDDFFAADVLETRVQTRFPGRICRSVHLRPLTRGLVHLPEKASGAADAGAARFCGCPQK